MAYADYLDAEMKVIPIYDIDVATGMCGCGNPDCKAIRKHPLQANWQQGVEYSDEQFEVMDMLGNLTAFGVLVDGYYVIDVDERNGGYEGLKAMNADLGYDITEKSGFVVKTGGNGLHIYFKNSANTPLVSHDKRYQGVDLKMSGFVVGCGSLHKSGNTYERIKGYPDEITELPDDMAAHFRKVERTYSVDGATYDNNDIGSMLEVLNPNSNYEEWVAVGMAVHHATDGAGFDLWDNWSSAGDSYPGNGELLFKWSSFGKCSAPVTAGTLVHLAKAAGWVQSCTFTVTADEVKQLEAAQETYAQKQDDCPVDYKNINIFQPPGFVGSVAQWINGNCLYPRERLSVLAAISAVSMVAGVNHVADVGWGDTQLNLFCVGLAGSASGKQDVIDSAIELIKGAGMGDTVNGDIRSSKHIYEGLLRHQASNVIMDEMGSLLKKAIGTKVADYQSSTGGVLMQAMTASKTLTCDVKLLDEEREKLGNKLSRILDRISNNEANDNEDDVIRQFDHAKSLLDGGICRPLFGVFGTTTESTFRQFVTMENVQSGLLGRAFIAQEHNDNPRKNRNFNPVGVPTHIKLKLGLMMANGSTETNHVDKILRSQALRKIKADTEALQLINELDDWFYDVAQQHEENGTGMVPVIRRSLEKIIKVAGVCAAAEGTITRTHIEYATALVVTTTGDLMQRAQSIAGAASKQQDERNEGLKSLIIEAVRADKTRTAIIRIVAVENAYKRADVAVAIDKMEEVGMIKRDETRRKNNACYFTVNATTEVSVC